MHLLTLYLWLVHHRLELFDCEFDCEVRFCHFIVLKPRLDRGSVFVAVILQSAQKILSTAGLRKVRRAKPSEIICSKKLNLCKIHDNLNYSIYIQRKIIFFL